MNKYEDEIVTHIKHGNLEYLQFKILNSYNVKNCITLRHGGVSVGEHESLNFRVLGTDNVENVKENLRRIKADMNFSDIHKATQAHTDNVVIIDSKNKDKYKFENFCSEEIDGYITKEKDIATLITTADCNPIIIFDTKNMVVANVHAGWKGVINRIYIKAIEVMQKKFDSKVEDIIVCIGPSIRHCCFTSKEESFKEKFTNVFDYSKDYMYYEKDNTENDNYDEYLDEYYLTDENYTDYDKDNTTFHIDLIKILKHEFIEKGIKEDNIYVADICTRCNTDDFFSYRKAVQSGQKDYATMATIVQLN